MGNMKIIFVSLRWYFFCAFVLMYHNFTQCHLKEGYGKFIHQYCQLLIVKLDFHQKNPGFPGNLVVSAEELEKIGENDINNYFQMSVEMFDYMDEILALQEASKWKILFE